MSSNKSYLVRLTIICYLLTFITGAAVVLPFVVKDNAALLLHASSSYAGYVFSLFMLGMLATEYINGFIIKHISLKTEIIIMCVLYLLCMIAMYYATKMQQLIPILVILGLIFGISTSIPNYIIISSFNQEKRSSRLNRNDMFFSIGSFFTPMVVGYMLQYHFTWFEVYSCLLILWVMILSLTLNTPLPTLHKDKKSQQHIVYSKWTPSIVLIGFAIFFYFVSYTGFTYWIQSYLTRIGLSITTASDAVTMFWLFYGIGCYLSSFMIHKIKVENYVIISATLSCVAYILLYLFTSVFSLYILISLLGLGCSTIYSSSISYGSLLVEKPSPRVVSFLLTSSGIGTFVGEFYSSYINTHLGFAGLDILSCVTMLLTILIYLYVMKIRKMTPKAKGKVKRHEGLPLPVSIN